MCKEKEKKKFFNTIPDIQINSMNQIRFFFIYILNGTLIEENKIVTFLLCQSLFRNVCANIKGSE